MSKRFGRNQKRRAREHIERLEKELADVRASPSILFRENSRLKRDIDLVRRALGPNSCLLEPVKQQMNSDPEPKMRTHAIRRRPPMFEENISPTAKIDDVTMDVLLASVNIDKWMNSLHFKFYFRDRTIGYAVSEEAVANIPRDVLVDIMSHEVAELLVQKLKEVGG